MRLNVYDAEDGNLGMFVRNQNFGGEVEDIVTDNSIDNINTNSSLLSGAFGTIKSLA